jgi:2-oxoisovalerate dehydrogenase E1 component alpha subunit
MTVYRVTFPGAVNSKFTSALTFEHPSTYPAIPTYRRTSPDGHIIDSSISPTPDSLALSMYENMLSVSIMDIIMFDAQRQGRLSFYMTSQGEEGTCVGSASALEKEDMVFLQYREAGVFVQRGYKLEDFMSQLFANRKDKGRGRNMPVHYGSKELNIVTLPSLPHFLYTNRSVIAYHLLTPSNTNPPSSWSSLCSQNAASPKPRTAPKNSSLLFRRRRCKRGRFPRRAQHSSHTLLSRYFHMP